MNREQIELYIIIEKTITQSSMRVFSDRLYQLVYHDCAFCVVNGCTLEVMLDRRPLNDAHSESEKEAEETKAAGKNRTKQKFFVFRIFKKGP